MSDSRLGSGSGYSGNPQLRAGSEECSVVVVDGKLIGKLCCVFLPSLLGQLVEFLVLVPSFVRLGGG